MHEGDVSCCDFRQRLLLCLTLLMNIYQVARAFEHFKPDLVVSVHPLMQIIPQRVNAALAR